MAIGQSKQRLDAEAKVTGRARYTDDMGLPGMRHAAYVHSTIAHGMVLSIDASEALALPGVEAVFTADDVPGFLFPTAGHPYSMDPSHGDVADRLLLTKHVRYYGDEVAVVVARDGLTARKAAHLVKVEYEPLPVMTSAETALAPGAPVLQPSVNPDGNLLKQHTLECNGTLDEALAAADVVVEGAYRTPTMQHCHLENQTAYAYMDDMRHIVIVSSTQIPHICRRVVGQALGIPWSSVRVIKPYIGGGFGVGIHNTLEAATFGLPVAFGPNYEKFKEARDLVTLGAARSVTDYEQLRTWFVPLRDNEEFLQKTSRIAKDYTTRHQGATGIIVKTIFH